MSYINKEQAIDLIESMIADKGVAFNPHKLAMALKDMESVEIPEAKDTDLISRQAAIEEVSKWLISTFGVYSTDNGIGVFKELRSLPPVEPPKKIVAQVKVDTDEIMERIKEECERIKEEYAITEKPVCEDCISRADTIKAMCSKCVINRECIGECSDVVVIKNMPPVEPERPKGDMRLYIPLNEYTVDRVNRLLKNECGEYFDEEWLYNELEQLAVLYPERPKGEWKNES